MIRHRTSPRVLLAALAVTACVPDAAPRDRLTEAYLRLIELEDARPRDGVQLGLLTQATASERELLRATAVRALGRLERPELAGHIEALLDDPARSVRLEAAYALAQAHFTSSGDDAFSPLAARLAVETDPEVRGELARSLGRLRLSEANRDRARRLLLAATRSDGGDAPVEELTGALLGLEALLRGTDEDVDLADPLVLRMLELSAYQGAWYRSPESVRVRSLALTVIGHVGAMRAPLLQRTLRDDAHVVPGVAMRFFDQIEVLAKPETMRRAVASRSLHTVIEAFRILDQQPRDLNTCGYLLAGARVPPANRPRPVPEPIRVLASRALNRPCPRPEVHRQILRDVAETLDDDPTRWQTASSAFLSLASVFPGDAAARLSEHASHANPFVRIDAAWAAMLLGNRAVLRSLATDPVANVRTAAVEGLFALDGHRADEQLLAQLEQDDPQLLLTVARLLAGTAHGEEAADRIVSTFERISARERETWRDPRVALVERLGEVGDGGLTERLIPFLSDYDPRVAAAVAEILQEWNGRPYTPTPHPLPRMPLPGVEEMHAMEGASVVLHMQGGGLIRIELHPWLATTNTYRFWRMAGSGALDGRTFHRWAPNFVIQGGSPNANEYSGEGPFTRDEVGRLPHWRGTVGISTRGHDTGDGQIFVNLLDNVRLDHAYTIVGTVVEGMDVIDRILEGAVIERAEVLPGS